MQASLVVNQTRFISYAIDSRLDENTYESLEENEEKRNHLRVVVEEMTADVSDGDHSCTGIVCNISKLGIGLMDLPETIIKKADKLSLIIRKEGVHYPMYLIPQWSDKNGSKVAMGGELENVPEDWGNFVTPIFQES